ncbi:hypothetical protein GCK72_000277 [Caenorhabditis remanei]|uniref:Uncharacterized protein n=1 Tax=Caenorhabditis remanei TaxID=31234 RepID=A0A6A5HLN8_CAERE|nr:hypothetical protein GCK72_000277 [Caenorhabditis remanei]KAF1768465.1 hypothetical protein GCK72_000277 [Caenorhabditis remanei]
MLCQQQSWYYMNLQKLQADNSRAGGVGQGRQRRGGRAGRGERGEGDFNRTIGGEAGFRNDGADQVAEEVEMDMEREDVIVNNDDEERQRQQLENSRQMVLNEVANVADELEDMLRRIGAPVEAEQQPVHRNDPQNAGIVRNGVPRVARGSRRDGRAVLANSDRAGAVGRRGRRRERLGRGGRGGRARRARRV